MADDKKKPAPSWLTKLGTALGELVGGILYSGPK